MSYCPFSETGARQMGIEGAHNVRRGEMNIFSPSNSDSSLLLGLYALVYIDLVIYVGQYLGCFLDPCVTLCLNNQIIVTMSFVLALFRVY